MNQQMNPAALPPGEMQMLQNGVYVPAGGVAKRTGSGVDVGTGATGSGKPIISGVRWYRGVPTVLKQMVVQSADQLWARNDTTGVYTSIGSLAAGSTPAFFAGAFDPAQSGVAGTPASDILVCAYGSGPPMKWDGSHFTQLSSAITNNFAGVTNWHEHLWLWGDPNNPDTLFATDLGNPESYTFSTNFGGYQIGRGDGDNTIQVAVGNENYLFVWKGNSIYVITGFDFATGDYQFNVQPLVYGVGTNAPHSVACIKEIPHFWTGARFARLNVNSTVGSELIDSIGGPAVREEVIAAQGLQGIIRAVGGTFLVAAPNRGSGVLYEDVYMCAVDDGTGVANKILLYDDEATKAFQGRFAWSSLTGLSVGAFIPWIGPGDQPRLYIGSAKADYVLQFGQNAISDSAMVIPVGMVFGADDLGSPNLQKFLDILYVALAANQCTITVNISTDNPARSATFMLNPTQPVAAEFGTAIFGESAFGTALATSYQDTYGKVRPWLRGKNFTVTFTESSATSMWELIGMTFHFLADAYKQ